MKKKQWIGVAFLVIACVLAFALNALMARPANKVPAIRLTKDVEVGTYITNDMISKIEISADAITVDTVTQESDIVGKYAKNNLYKDDMVNKKSLTNDEYNHETLFYGLEKGKQYVTVTLKSLASSVAGRIKPNDIVSIYTLDEEEEPILYDELLYVKVVSLTNELGNEVSNEGTVDLKENLPTTITLEVNQQQAEKLILLENNEVMHFSFIFRGNTEQVNEYLQIQDRYFEKGE